MKKHWILGVAVILFVLGVVFFLVTGTGLSSGDYACGYFAAGNFACGVFAAGQFSVGIFSAGIFSIGIFSISIFNIGLYAIGFFVYGWKKRGVVLQSKNGLK